MEEIMLTHSKSPETQYLELAEKIMDQGEDRGDRTGTGTRSLFGEQMVYDLREGFPALTTKKVALGTVATELTWMLHGDRNLQYLVQNDCNIWNEWPFVSYLKKAGIDKPKQGSPEWKQLMGEYVERVKVDDEFAAEFGDLGPVYGYQWRHWPDGTPNGIDQLGIAEETIRTNPESRRIIVNSWNVAELDEMSKSGLPPCHMFYQFYASKDGYLDMVMYQRSADLFLGVPFNMAQYALLLSMMAQTTDREPRKLVHQFGDVHIYRNHVDQISTQLARTPYDMPRLELDPAITTIGDFSTDHITFHGYQHHPAIKADVAI
jgi:thymidylate synthase